jgi:hypothetical protein
VGYRAAFLGDAACPGEIINNMKKAKLNLGILLDSYEVPAWAYNAIERINHSTCAKFSLIILNDRNENSESKWIGLWKNRRNMVYLIHNKIDEKFNHQEPNAFAQKNLQEILPGVPAINVRPIQKGDSEYFGPMDVQKIRGQGLDILIKMGFGFLQGGILTASKFGIWGYYHGDYSKIRSDTPGFWEVLENWPETGSGLCILGEGNGGTILYRSWSFTHPFSPARNRNCYFWTSSLFLPRQIELLHRLGEKAFLQEIEKFNRGFSDQDYRRYKIPSNLLAIKLLAKLFAKMAYRALQKAFFLDQWVLLFERNHEISTSFRKFRKVIPPKDRFWADPQAIQDGGRYYIFVEEYIYRKGKGHISVLEMGGDGKWGDPVRILEKDYHLSYPFVFKWEGSYFMVPESAQNKSIELYECIEFPHLWKLKINLMEKVTAVDTTLFRYDGKWWLFAAIAENEGSFPQVELFLFFSKDLFTSKWNPHPLNPIISDVKRARPAGPLFVLEGRIFRPSQDCSRNYGYGFDLNEIVRLSEREYHEKKSVSVRAGGDSKMQAIHTFSREGELTLMDGLMRRRKIF